MPTIYPSVEELFNRLAHGGLPPPESELAVP